MTQASDLRADAASTEVDRQEALYVWPPLILSIVFLWIVPLWSSMGLDESGNWWVIKDGWSEMLRRAALWSGGQSILFNMSVMAVRQVAGDSDVVLRIPSVLLMLGTLLLLYRLGLRFGGPFVAMMGCLALVAQREVVYIASVVRPFALGLFLATAAMFALLRWLDTGRIYYAMLYVLCAGLTPYANYMHGSMFLVHGICAFIRIHVNTTPVRIWQLLVGWSTCIVVMIPLLQQALSLYGRRKQEGYLGSPNLEELMSGVFPMLLVGVVLASVLIYTAARWLLGKNNLVLVREWGKVSSNLAEPLIWAIVPPAGIVLLGMFTDLRLFAGRYFVVNAPGIALVSGIGIRSLAAASLRRYLPIVIAVSAVFSIGFHEGFMRGLYNYRGAFAAVQRQVVNQDTPIIFVSGFIESSNFANVLDPVLSKALMAPALRYFPTGHLIVVPSLPSPEAENYMETLVQNQLQSQKRFIVCGLFGAEFYRVWLNGRLATNDFRLAVHSDYGGVGVYVFEKITS